MKNYLWVLGADDPEMSAIEKLLQNCGENYVYATVNGARVHPGNAYKADNVSAESYDHIVLVECQCREYHLPFTIIDHHRPGDPGYGKSPEDFLSASSIGQVISLLVQLERIPYLPNWSRMCQCTAGKVGELRLHHWLQPETDYEDGSFEAPTYVQPTWTVGFKDVTTKWVRFIAIPFNLVLAAAADHCLGAAYQGKCPGIDPEILMAWRIKTKAKHQNRPDVCCVCGHTSATLDTERENLGGEGPCGDFHQWMDGVTQIENEVAYARQRLRIAVTRYIDPASGLGLPFADSPDWEEIVLDYADFRGLDPIPELPEAAAREGIPFLATVKDRDGREKVVLQVAGPELVKRFMDGSLVPGLVDVYGDPARGFAGGYKE